MSNEEATKTYEQFYEDVCFILKRDYMKSLSDEEIRKYVDSEIEWVKTAYKRIQEADPYYGIITYNGKLNELTYGLALNY